MDTSISDNTKSEIKRGRPRSTGKGELIGVRLLPLPLANVDAWAAGQPGKPSRPEAIRRLIEMGLASSSASEPSEGMAVEDLNASNDD